MHSSLRGGPIQVKSLDASSAARGGRPLSTTEVRDTFIRGATGAPRGNCRFVEVPEEILPAERWARDSADPLYFVSHAWGNPFSLVVESLLAHFRAAGAIPDCVFVWVDIFAVNQWDGVADLSDGATLARTIELSTASLVVLDTLGMPFTRLWREAPLASQATPAAPAA